jgi:hypothetical protein
VGSFEKLNGVLVGSEAAAVDVPVEPAAAEAGVPANKFPAFKGFAPNLGVLEPVELEKNEPGFGCSAPFGVPNIPLAGWLELPKRLLVGALVDCPLSVGGGPAGVVEPKLKGLVGAGVVEPGWGVVVTVGFDPNKLVEPDGVLRLVKSETPGTDEVGLFSLFADAPPKLKEPTGFAFVVLVALNSPPLGPEEVVATACFPPNRFAPGVLPVLLFAPKRGVEAPDPGLDPEFIPPKIDGGCAPPPPPVKEPKEPEPPAVVPLKRFVVGLDVAVDCWPKGEEVLGVALAPKKPPDVVFDAGPEELGALLPPAGGKLNGDDIVAQKEAGYEGVGG